MKRNAIKFLLWILNSRWLNKSPCQYAYVGNVEAFSYSNLASEEKQRPGITVKTILEEADRFKACPMNKNGVTVIEANGEYHEATVWDIQELKQSLERPQPSEEAERD